MGPGPAPGGGVAGLPSVQIATAADLAGLREVVALGFPLGSALAAKGKDYPTVNVNKGKVRAVKGADGQPSEIEADVSINSGNSGGPLLDGKGRVAGVIFARYENRVDHSGHSLAVPANRLESFLSRPAITFEPPTVTRGQGQTGRVQGRPPFPLPASGPAERGARPGRVGQRGAISDDARRWGVPGEGRPIHRGAREETSRRPTRNRLTELSTVAWVEDRSLEGEGRSFLLSEVKTLKFDPSPLVWMKREGGGLPKKLTGLDAVMMEIKRQEVNFDPAHVTEISVGDAEDVDLMPCTVVARRSGRPVSRAASPLLANDPGGAGLKAVSEGRFVRPRRIANPVTAFRFHIPAGDPISTSMNPNMAEAERKFVSVEPGDPPGPGTTYKKEGGVSLANEVGIGRGPFIRGGLGIVGIGPPGWMTLVFKAPNGERVKVGEYLVKADDAADLRGPSAYVQAIFRGPPGRVVGYSGRVMVWEIEEVSGARDDRGRLERLAVDFVLHRKSDRPGGGDEPSVSGMVRLRSRFE